MPPIQKNLKSVHQTVCTKTVWTKQCGPNSVHQTVYTKQAGAGLKSVDLWRYSGRQGWLGFLHCSVVCRPTTQCLLKIFLRWVVETDLGIGHPLGPAADYILLSTVERKGEQILIFSFYICLLYTSPSPRDGLLSRMPSSA